MTNNKQQTAVELYTEEQVRKAIELSRDTHPQGMGYVVKDVYDYSMDEVVDLLTPIQLPSDEEVKKMMELDGMEFDEFDPYDVSYLGGATWMRNKIQGGEQ
jgi:hypothetical protein